MNNSLPLLFLAMSLSACSTFDDKPTYSKQVTGTTISSNPISERGHTVESLSPKSDVAGIVPGRRHTLGFREKYNRSLTKTEGIQVAAAAAPLKATSIKQAVVKTDWERYCDGQFVSAETEKRLESEAIPAMLRETCRPMK